MPSWDGIGCQAWITGPSLDTSLACQALRRHCAMAPTGVCPLPARLIHTGRVALIQRWHFIHSEINACVDRKARGRGNSAGRHHRMSVASSAA